jgi:DNA-binding MarR family transcriptional regulator
MDLRLRQLGYNITPVQTQALQAISRAGREINQRELEQAMRLKAPTVNGILGRLEEKGYILRRASPADGRCRLVSLTEEGRAMVETFRSVLEEVNRVFLADLTREEEAQLRGLLLRITANLENEVNRA